MSPDDPSDDELQSVATGGDTATVDLQDLVDDLDDQIEEFRSRKNAYEKAPSDEDRENVDWPPETFPSDYPIKDLEHSRSLVEQSIEAFGGSEFVVRKARAGEAARATSLTAESCVETGSDPLSQAALSEHHIVQVCVERVPPDAPTTTDDRLDTMALENEVFEYLRQRVENFNTYGTVSIDDF